MNIETTNNSSTLFYPVIKEVLLGRRNDTSNFNELLEEISLVAAHRGLNDDEFSLLLNFVKDGPMSLSNKCKLLSTLVPCSEAPSAAVKCFLAWFISKFRNLKVKLSKQILQWIIGLLNHDLVDPSVLNIFYFDYIIMLKFKELVKDLCNLLCKLTQPQDVTSHLVWFVAKKYTACGGKDDKYLLAVLNVFEGYKPHLTKKAELIVKKINVNKVFQNSQQKIDFYIKLRWARTVNLEKTVPGTVQLIPFTVHNIASNSRNSQYKVSSLMPVPTFDAESLDKCASIHPNSIEGAFLRLKNIPVPEDLFSLLCDNIGLFLLMYRGKHIQTRFSTKILHTLQEVFIHQGQEATEEDKEFLLTRLYELSMFMQQGLQCVSTFLAGYLLHWDGLDHRYRVLSLIEWVTFDSFQELSSNILRPLYLLFISYDTTMKKQILQTCTKLISNMFTVDLSREEKGLPRPFLHNSPRWTSAPITMLQPLVSFVEGLIKVGMCLHPGQSSLLFESIHFYETMNMLESRTNLPMWTVISQGIIGHTLFNIAPVALNKICKLLLRYHTEFLPRLRTQQPQYYSHCLDKVNLTSKYCQELINLLWNGQAMSRKEDGVILKEISDETFESVIQLCNRTDFDTSFDVAYNLNLLPYIFMERKKNGRQFLSKKTDFVAMLEFHLEDIAEFIKQFSSMNESQY